MPIEVRAKIVFDGDAAALQKSIDTTTDKVKKLNSTAKEFSLKDAADSASKAIHERGQVQNELIRRGVIEDPNKARQKAEEDRRKAEEDRRRDMEKRASSTYQADQFVERQRVQAATQAELVNRGVIEDPKLVSQRKADAQSLVDKSKALVQEQQTRAQARQTLAMQGLGFAGMGGVAGGYGQGQIIGSALEGAGFAGLGRMAGPIGAGIAAAGMTANYMKETERYRTDSLYANPYMDEGTRQRGLLGAAPFGKTILDYQDTFSGRTEGFARNEESRERLGARNEHELRAGQTISDSRRQIAAASATRESIYTNKFAPLETFDRSTDRGQRQSREAEALVEPRRQAVIAERELSKAIKDRVFVEQRSVELVEKRREVGIDIWAQTKLETGFLKLQQNAEYMADYSVGTNAARLRKDEAVKKDQGLIAQQMDNTSKLKEANDREAMARRNLEAKKIDIERAELGNLKAQEAFAANAAGRIGGMGPVARAVGLNALRVVVNNADNIENLRPELLDQASSVSPGHIARLKEQAGQRLARGAFGIELRALGAEEDIHNVDRLSELRNKVNEEGVRIGAKDQGADERLGDALVKGSAALKGIETLLGEELPKILERLDTKLKLLANGVNAGR